MQPERLALRILAMAVGVGFVSLPQSTWAIGKQKGSVLRNVEPPPGSSVGYYRDANGGRHWEYEAPPDFEKPIRIKYKEGPDAPPDILVWADIIHWNDTTQSATASGRIIIDDQKEYRIETTYMEYNHALQQIYCPRKVKIIQRTPEGGTNHMVATSAIVTLDEDGIKDARFEKLISTSYTFDRKSNPLRKKKGSKTKTGKRPSKTAKKKGGLTAQARKAPSPASID